MKVNSILAEEDDYYEAEYDDIVTYSRRISKNYLIMSSLSRLTINGSYNKTLKLVMT